MDNKEIIEAGRQFLIPDNCNKVLFYDNIVLWLGPGYVEMQPISTALGKALKKSYYTDVKPNKNLANVKILSLSDLDITNTINDEHITEHIEGVFCQNYGIGQLKYANNIQDSILCKCEKNITTNNNICIYCENKSEETISLSSYDKISISDFVDKMNERFKFATFTNTDDYNSVNLYKNQTKNKKEKTIKNKFISLFTNCVNELDDTDEVILDAVEETAIELANTATEEHKPILLAAINCIGQLFRHCIKSKKE